MQHLQHAFDEFARTKSFLKRPLSVACDGVEILELARNTFLAKFQLLVTKFQRKRQDVDCIRHINYKYRYKI